MAINSPNINPLLERYYDGVSTTADVDAITDYMRSHPEHPDAAIFLAISQLSSELPEMDTDLEGKLLRRDKVLPIRLMAWLGGVAAAAVLLIVALTWQPQSALDLAPYAFPDASIATAQIVETPQVEEIPTQRVAEATPIPKVKTIKDKKSTETEVTDPAEAAAILKKLASKLDRTMAQASAATSTTVNSLETVNQAIQEYL
ncbi:MAG: hypothetical protein LUC85_00375 [Bacteroidales bacterium]|nr:hypothetical protein [Bacteroidales bacterium]MCD8393274.1 hypothetical protein [Bacteroidales bacterium]